MTGLFVRHALPTELRLELYLLPEERAAVHERLRRLTAVAPLVGKAWLSDTTMAFATGNRKITLTLPVRRAVWLAEFLRARISTTTAGHERRGMDTFLGALRHNLSFRCGVQFEERHS
jgi:hypothetical protein